MDTLIQTRLRIQKVRFNPTCYFFYAFLKKFQKIAWLIFVFFVILFSFFVFSLNVSAAGPWKGDAFVNRNNAALGTRNFALRTADDQNTAGDRGAWELNAGESITLYFKTWTTGTPPDAPQSVILRVYSDNGATQIRELHNGAPPADGTSYTFYATDNGLDTGTVKAGMYRLYVQAVCSEAIDCPLGTYDINSDSDGDKGGVRSAIKISDITKNAYPTGSQYAYGPSGDETMTFTANHTGRLEDTGTNQTIRLNTRRNSGSIIENGTSKEPSASSTDTDFIADNTYDPTNGTSYDTEFEIVGNSNLLTSEKWTHIATADNGANITRDSATVARYANRFVVDPRIYFSTDGSTTNDNVNTGETVYNRGETATFNFYLLNSRDEQLSRDMNVSVLASDNTVEDGPSSLTPSSNLYSSSYSVASGDVAVADDTGDLHKFRATNTNQTKDSNNAHGVSSKYYIDMHPQLNNTTLNSDDFPNEDANEAKVGIIAADVFNFFIHVKNVRKDTDIDTSGDAATITLKKPDASTRTTFTIDTGADGWSSSQDFSAEAPGGTWTVTGSASFNGNSGSDEESLVFVSPYSGKFRIDTVGWNQTYNIGDTSRFTVRTMQLQSNGINFEAQAADSIPQYDLKYWDGATWQDLDSGNMTELSAEATYETTYAIPNDSAWIGRKIAVFFKTQISGTEINVSREIEIVGSPAQVIIQSMADTDIPTISADVRITNEGTAAFEYTYEWCVVTVDTNQCGGGDDIAYGSAAKLIQATQNFDTTLTLNVTQTGEYIFKVAVWWSNQSSKASRTFTASTAGNTSGGGGSSGNAVNSVTQPIGSQNNLTTLGQRITTTLTRVLGLETRMNNLEVRVAILERKLDQRPAPAPRTISQQPKKTTSKTKIETPPSYFKIRLR